MIDYIFGSASFVPHGYCLLWRPDLVAMHVGGDVITFIAYSVIAFSIWRFTTLRPEFKYSAAALVSAAFVFGCGITHLVGAVSLWWPAYGMQGILKLIVSGISVTAAIMIWRLLPKIVEIPSGAQVAEQHELLSNEIAERQRAEREILKRAKIERRLRNRETELKIALNRARDADTAKDKFLAAMSHDLRTPLNAIIGFSDALLIGIFGRFNSEKQREYVDNISHSGKHLLSLITDLLDFSNMSNNLIPHKPEYENVVEIVDQSLAEIRVARSYAQIERSPVQSEFDPELFVDSQSLKRMITNLVVNAVKYAGEAGPVTVSFQEDASDIRLIVEDCGKGFAAENVETFRQPFVQENSLSDGIGLGLSIVDMLARQHGGRLEITNREKGGARVSIVMPASVVRPSIEESEPQTEKRKPGLQVNAMQQAT